MNAARRILDEAGFGEAAIRRTVGSSQSPESMRVNARRLSAEDPTATLVRLFVLGETVPESTVPIGVDDLVVEGLLERDGESVRSPLRLSPHEGLLIAHDGENRIHEADYVTGINSAALTLACLTVRSPVARALDLGTGCGIQALLATRHAETVVATDINPRALRYAELNASLNDLDLDVREGSLFEPVAGEEFGLVVANPPFVISPGSDYLFRDSGVPGDTFTRDVVRGAAAHLAEGGFATVLANWICDSPEDRWRPLVPWVEGTGCDAILLGHEGIDPLRYAALWNEPLRRNAAAFSASVDRWLEYYEGEGIGAVGVGAVVLRRRTGENWVRGFDLTRPNAGSASDQILRIFAAHDHLAMHPDEAQLLEEHLRPVAGHRLEQTLVYGDEYQIADVTMSLDDSVGLVGDVDPAAMSLLFALEPDRPLGDVLDAAGLEQAVALPMVRRLYEQGFLERVT